MNDFGDILGALMVGMIRARRLADEETTALAEYYKDNPLLEGMAVPRVRIPEMTMDIPVLVEGVNEGQANSIEDPNKVGAVYTSQLQASMKSQNVRTAATFTKAFDQTLKAKLASLKSSETNVTKELIARYAQESLATATKQNNLSLTTAQSKAILADLRNVPNETEVVKVNESPKLLTNIVTADVKEKAGAGNVVRVKITLREEGLEWTTEINNEGEVKQTLTPE